LTLGTHDQPPSTYSSQHYLEYLLAGDLQSTVSALGLETGELLLEDLELVHQVPLVLGYRRLALLLTAAFTEHT